MANLGQGGFLTKMKGNEGPKGQNEKKAKMKRNEGCSSTRGGAQKGKWFTLWGYLLLTDVRGRTSCHRVSTFVV